MLEKSTISFIMKLEKRDGGCEVFDIMTMAENIKTYRNKKRTESIRICGKIRNQPTGGIQMGVWTVLSEYRKSLCDLRDFRCFH